jgi:hypothetical protein
VPSLQNQVWTTIDEIFNITKEFQFHMTGYVWENTSSSTGFSPEPLKEVEEFYIIEEGFASKSS